MKPSDLLVQLSSESGTAVVYHDAAPSQASGLMQTLPMMVAILAIFYFLMIRPQQKEAKALAELIGSLVKGDQVVTASGLHGRVAEVREDTVLLEVADKVRVVVDKSSIKRKVADPTVTVVGKPT